MQKAAPVRKGRGSPVVLLPHPPRRLGFFGVRDRPCACCTGMGDAPLPAPAEGCSEPPQLSMSQRGRTFHPPRKHSLSEPPKRDRLVPPPPLPPATLQQKTGASELPRLFGMGRGRDHPQIINSVGGRKREEKGFPLPGRDCIRGGSLMRNGERLVSTVKFKPLGRNKLLRKESVAVGMPWS